METIQKNNKRKYNEEYINNYDDLILNYLHRKKEKTMDLENFMYIGIHNKINNKELNKILFIFNYESQLIDSMIYFDKYLYLKINISYKYPIDSYEYKLIQNILYGYFNNNYHHYKYSNNSYEHLFYFKLNEHIYFYNSPVFNHKLNDNIKYYIQENNYGYFDFNLKCDYQVLYHKKILLNKSVHKKPFLDKSVHKKPLLNKPVCEKPLMDKPVHKKPFLDKTVHKKPFLDKPVCEKPLLNKPVHKKPLLDKPVCEKPLLDKPVCEKHKIQLIHNGNINYIQNKEDLIKSIKVFNLLKIDYEIKLFMNDKWIEINKTVLDIISN
jgi:hypothetical protein